MASAPRLGSVTHGEVARLDEAVPACFESGWGAAAAAEARFGACLIASPLPDGDEGDEGGATPACLDVAPLCGG